MGRTPFDLVPPEEAARVAEVVRPCFEQGLPLTHVENTNLHKDGHLVVLDTSGVPVFDEEGVLKGFRGIDRDITKQKRAEEALRESEELFRALVEQSMDGMALADLKTLAHHHGQPAAAPAPRLFRRRTRRSARRRIFTRRKPTRR